MIHKAPKMFLSELTKIQKILLFFLPLVLTLVFGIFGSDYSDQSFVRGFSWRLRLGELPYVDFIYPRPPLTIYMDAFFKILSPVWLEVFTERLRYYFQLLLVVLLVFRKFPFQTRENSFFIIVGTYLLTLGSFPPTSWYTVDGILFSALAYAFVGFRDWRFGWCLFFGFCAALTKQSFYPVPLFLLGYYAFNVRLLGIFPLFIGAIPGFAFWLFLIGIDGIDPFLLQTTGITRFQDVIKSGFFVYLQPTNLKHIIFFITSYLLFKKKPKWSLIFILIVLGYDFFKFLGMTAVHEQSSPAKDWPRTLFVMSFLYLASRIGSTGTFRFWFLLCIAWCTSLSWGYQTPVLFIAGLVAISINALKICIPSFTGSYVIRIFFCCSVLMFSIQNLNRHRQGRLWDNHYHLGDLDKKYSLIFTNQRTFKLYEEMKDLVKKGPASFLPAFSDADYFLNRNSSLPLNWISDIEIGKAGEQFRKALRSCKGALYVYEKDYSVQEYSHFQNFRDNSPCPKVIKSFPE